MRKMVTVVVCVCLSFKSLLISGASVHPENTVTYSEGNGDKKIREVFSETAQIQHSLCFKAIRAFGHFHACTLIIVFTTLWR